MGGTGRARGSPRSEARARCLSGGGGPCPAGGGRAAPHTWAGGRRGHIRSERPSHRPPRPRSRPPVRPVLPASPGPSERRGRGRGAGRGRGRLLKARRGGPATSWGRRAPKRLQHPVPRLPAASLESRTVAAGSQRPSSPRRPEAPPLSARGAPPPPPDPLEPGPGQASDRPPGPGVCPRRRRSARGLGGCTRKQAAWRSTVTCRLGPEAPSTDRGTDRWPPGGGRVWTELAILLDFAARSASVLQAPGRSVPRSHPSPHGSWGSPEPCCPRLQPVPPPESEPSDPILRTPRQLCLFLFGCLQHSPKFPLLLCPLHPPPLGAP